MRGSCLCGEVRYEVSGPITDVLNCHCSICRKAHSAAFRTRGRVAAADFRFLSGESLLTWYASSADNRRSFCSKCGSAIVVLFDAAPDARFLSLGTLDDDPGVKPAAHCFTAEKAHWHDIADDLPQFPGHATPPRHN
jgi:hypothetical protein